METMTAKTDEEMLSENLGVRVTKADLARVDALAERYPLATRHGIARMALRLGLAAIEENPMLLLGDAPKAKPKGKTKR